MRTVLWMTEPGLPDGAIEGILGGLAARGIPATLRETPAGRVVAIEDPPEDLPLPPGILRRSTVDLPAGAEWTRRAVLDRIATVMAGGAAVTAGFLGALYASPPPLPADRVEEVLVGPLATVRERGAVPFRFGRDACVVISSGERLVALSIVCTHLGCLVSWEPARGVLACPCHRASFDVDGRVLEGPPPRPLTAYAVIVENDLVYVRRKVEA